MKRSVMSLEDFHRQYGVDAPEILLEINAEDREAIHGKVASIGFRLPDIKNIRQMGHGKLAVDLVGGKTIYT